MVFVRIKVSEDSILSKYVDFLKNTQFISYTIHQKSAQILWIYIYYFLFAKNTHLGLLNYFLQNELRADALIPQFVSIFHNTPQSSAFINRPVSNSFLHYFLAQCTMIFYFPSFHNSAIFSNFIHFPETYVKRLCKNRDSNGHVDPPFASIFTLSNLTKTQTRSAISSFF